MTAARTRQIGLVALVAALAVAAVYVCVAALGGQEAMARLSGTYETVVMTAEAPHTHVPGTPEDHAHEGPAREHWLHTPARDVRLHLPAGLPPVPPGPVEVTGTRLEDGSLQVTRLDVTKP